tara:strand:- start:2850 stop:4097 length:1248 start_codon:yes stop_codon:yes gene_type:complete
MIDKPLTVLVSVYACGPSWGSEIGMGWNWVIHLSNYCQLHVITEAAFKEDIEKKIPELNLKFNPIFYYNDIGDKGRRLFWKQGSFLFYRYYKKWQQKALQIAENIIKNNHIDIVHQLNMIGYREPGYLWKINTIPYIIGPIGGYEQFPLAYFSLLNTRDKVFYGARNIINYLQSNLLSRPKKAYTKAVFAIVATKSGYRKIQRYTTNNPILISEVGAYPNIGEDKLFANKKEKEKFVITWVGILSGRKGLPLALKAIAKSKFKNKIILNVVGYGNNKKDFKKLAKSLQLENVVWHGKLPNVEAKRIIQGSNLFFLTSLLEATSTVVFEALQSKTPVLCHDICGFGSVIDENCGVKIPLINPEKSVELFSLEIDNLIENPEKLYQMQKGCKKTIKDHYWENKGLKMMKLYKRCLES